MPRWKKNPNKQASELIRLYQRDKLTLQEIAEQLKKHGFRTRTGKLFQAETVRRLLNRNQNDGAIKHFGEHHFGLEDAIAHGHVGDGGDATPHRAELLVRNGKLPTLTGKDQAVFATKFQPGQDQRPSDGDPIVDSMMVASPFNKPVE